MDSYVAVARQEMVLLHGNLPECYALHIKRVSRAAARGRGPAKQASDLPFSRLQEYASRTEPMSPAGPCYPGRVAIIASWWMLREKELNNLPLDCIKCEDDSAELMLPVSKMDPTAKGTSRSLCCTCSSTPSSLCPFHTIKAQYDWAHSISSSPSSPLCPTTTGEADNKEGDGSHHHGHGEGYGTGTSHSIGGASLYRPFPPGNRSHVPSI